MGIKNILSYLRRYEDLIESINISQFKGQTLALDVSVFLYRYLATFQEKWLSAFQHLIQSFQHFQINIIYVFDGVPLSDKRECLELRRENKQKFHERMKHLKETLVKYSNGSIDETS